MIVGWKVLPSVNKAQYQQKVLAVRRQSHTGIYYLSSTKNIENNLVSTATHYNSVSESQRRLSASEDAHSNLKKFESKDFFSGSEFKESRSVKSSSSTVVSRSTTKFVSEKSSCK